MTDKMSQKSQSFFYCNCCDYKSSKKTDYIKHLSTNKHKILTDTDGFVASTLDKKYICKCGRNYKHRQSLFTHQKKCKIHLELNEEMSKNIETNKIYKNKIIDTEIDNSKINNIINSHIEDEKNNTNKFDYENKESTSNLDYKNMFFKMMDENKEVKNLLISQQKQIENQQKQIGDLIPKVGNNNNNQIKQKFNLNIFLNEHCKDAINMNDFIESLNVSLKQLNLTKEKGLAEGLTNVFIENMSKLSVYERPLHCTDVKRETLYIKDNNMWEKDGDKSKIKQAIKEASNKQFKTLQEWTEENPDFKEVDDKKEYFVHALTNVSKDIKKIDDKIIKKICSNAYLKESLDKEENNDD